MNLDRLTPYSRRLNYSRGDYKRLMPLKSIFLSGSDRVLKVFLLLLWVDTDGNLLSYKQAWAVSCSLVAGQLRFTARVCVCVCVSVFILTSLASSRSLQRSLRFA